MNTIRAVFFDYDGVIGADDHSYTTTCRFLAEAAKLDYDTVRGAYTRFVPGFRTGKITEKQIWPEFCEQIGADIPYKKLEEAFASSTLNKDVMTIAQNLKDSGILVGMITDNSNARLAIINKKHSLDTLFKPIINGSKFSTSKTNTRSAVAMFEAALQAHNLRADEALFIDNVAENLSVPEAMGFHIYHHDAELNDILALKIYLSGFGLIV